MQESRFSVLNSARHTTIEWFRKTGSASGAAGQSLLGDSGLGGLQEEPLATVADCERMTGISAIASVEECRTTHDILPSPMKTSNSLF